MNITDSVKKPERKRAEHQFQIKKFRKPGCILLGNLIYSAAVAFFILPNHLPTGGTTGLALIALRLSGIPVSVFVLIFNVVMFFLGFLLLGREFAVTTLASTVVYPAFLQMWQMISERTGVLTEDVLLAAVFAGVMIGIGLGLVIREGASTGGMDIPPLIINKYTGLSVSGLLTVFDLAILILCSVDLGWERLLYGILLVCLYNLILEQMLVIGKRQVQISIISDRYEEICRWVTGKLDRGCTLVSAEGGYLRHKTMEVVTVVSKREVFRVNEAVKRIDPDAFMVIGQVSEVSGRGFTKGRVYR